MEKDIELKIEELLNRMSLHEKIGQLNQPETPTADNMEEFKNKVRRSEVGSVLMSVGATAGNDAQGGISVDFYNEIQRIAVEESKSGIPVLFGRDVIHGHRTVFPIPLAMSASFNGELIEKSYSDIAAEASNDSIHWTFTPMLDLSRDPRWGRIIEGPGEDPYLGSLVARSAVKGLQGDDVSKNGKILACAKHFIGYGASEGGRDYHRTEITDYSLFNYYLPAFRSAVDAGALTVMSSFNDISGQPITNSKYYLTDILREKLGFKGFVVSDYDAVDQLKKQGLADNDYECASMSLPAGLDMDMHDGIYMDNLEKAVEDGLVSEEEINTAVRRVLYVKLKKGLFDNPYCEKQDIDRKKHLEDAREMAAESVVLLKNDGVLPLDKNKSVCLAGPFIYERRSLLGSWTLDGKESETPNMYEAMKEKCNSAVNDISGVGLSWDSSVKWMCNSDVIVLCLGESWSSTGEHRAVSNISISPEQKLLMEKARQTGKKTVGVLFCGRPVEMQEISDTFDAVVYAWHGGSMCAKAVADILYGDSIPSGRMPMTAVRKATHIPLYYNVTSSGRPVNCYYGENAGDCYIDSLATPCYPFGYGLSYTKFSYSDIVCNKDKISFDDIKKGEKFTFSIDISNVGEYDGKEVVQLYIHDKKAKMMRPIKELKGINKVFIKKGEKVTARFTLGFSELGYYLPNGEYTVEKGIFEIFIGENSLTDRKVLAEII